MSTAFDETVAQLENIHRSSVEDGTPITSTNPSNFDPYLHRSQFRVAFANAGRLEMILFLVGVIRFSRIGTETFLLTGLCCLPISGISAAVAGQLATVFALTYAIGSPILAVLFSNFDRKTLLLFRSHQLLLWPISRLVFRLTSATSPRPAS